MNRAVERLAGALPSTVCDLPLNGTKLGAAEA